MPYKHFNYRSFGKKSLFLLGILICCLPAGVWGQKWVIPPGFDDMGPGIVNGFIGVKTGNKWGIVDTNGTTVLSPALLEPVYFSLEHQKVAGRNPQKRAGYLSLDGDTAISFMFDYAYPFFENRALVYLNQKAGYIDLDGDWLVQPEYDYGGHFHNHRAPVKRDEKWGVITETGELVIPLQYDFVQQYSEGLAAVESNGNWGFVDTSGRLVIAQRYEDAGFFSQGLAPVRDRGKWGYVNRAGEWVIKPKYEEGSRPFADSLAAVSRIVGNRYLFAFINSDGKELTGFDYEAVGDFSNGIAPAKSDGLWGFIDSGGKWVIQPEYEEVRNISNGLIPVRTEKGWGVISITR